MVTLRFLKPGFMGPQSPKSGKPSGQWQKVIWGPNVTYHHSADRKLQSFQDNITNSSFRNSESVFLNPTYCIIWIFCTLIYQTGNVLLWIFFLYKACRYFPIGNIPWILCCKHIQKLKQLKKLFKSSQYFFMPKKYTLHFYPPTPKGSFTASRKWQNDILRIDLET